MNTKELTELVKARFGPPEYALFFNVADGTGYSSSRRWADGIAVSIWPSRGLEIHGLELKVSRGDWKKELAAPAKAEAICKYCDRWWVVAGDKSIVADGELPPTWGLLVPHGKGLTAAVEAPKLTPVPLDKRFVVALCRRAFEQSADKEELERVRQEALKQGREDGESRVEYEVKKLREVAVRVKEFTDATGIDLSDDYKSKFRWHKGKEIGAAVMAVMSQRTDALSELSQLRSCAQRIVAMVDELEVSRQSGDAA